MKLIQLLSYIHGAMFGFAKTVQIGQPALRDGCFEAARYDRFREVVSFYGRPLYGRALYGRALRPFATHDLVLC
jgi:hypothetical protein